MTPDRVAYKTGRHPHFMQIVERFTPPVGNVLQLPRPVADDALAPQKPPPHPGERNQEPARILVDDHRSRRAVLRQRAAVVHFAVKRKRLRLPHRGGKVNAVSRLPLLPESGELSARSGGDSGVGTEVPRHIDRRPLRHLRRSSRPVERTFRRHGEQILPGEAGKNPLYRIQQPAHCHTTILP